MLINLKLYCASLMLTLVMGALLAVEVFWLVPIGLAGLAVIAVVEYAKTWVLRGVVADRFRRHPPVLGLFAGMGAGLLTLWLASGFWLSGALSERMVLFIIMLMLCELACLALPGRGGQQQQAPFRMLYTNAGKHA